MKKFHLTIFVLLLLSSCIGDDLPKSTEQTSANEEITATEFVKGSEDIPLVNKLEILENENVDFDSSSGRISRVEYKSSINLETVQEFYLKTLPQMGWKLVQNDQNRSLFTREGQKLEIQFFTSEEEKSDIVKFSINPK